MKPQYRKVSEFSMNISIFVYYSSAVVRFITRFTYLVFVHVSSTELIKS